MLLIISGAAILVGFVLGYFFNTTVVIIISVAAAILAIALRPRREQELGALIGVIAWLVLGLGFLAMLITHLYVNGTSLGIPDLGKYIFRQS